MKKIGKEVLFNATNEKNIRNGEGSFARLSDGRIIYAYTLYGAVRDDDAAADIMAQYSSDEGETWSEAEMLYKRPDDARNVMSTSLITLPNGKLAMAYLRKDTLEDGKISCMPIFVTSDDDGKTWSDPINIESRLGYYCGINDSLEFSPDGKKLYYTASYSGLYVKDVGFVYEDGYINTICCIYVSEDFGQTWKRIVNLVSPYVDDEGLYEPGIYAHQDGSLWVYMRTFYGFQYYSKSYDGGKTWTTPAPQLCFTSPDSPMRVKKIRDYTVAVFNPLPFNCTLNAFEWGCSAKRTPLICSISYDDGESFFTKPVGKFGEHFRQFIDNSYYIEDDLSDSYCYPAIFETKDGFIIAYYHSNSTIECLDSGKITKVYFDEIK